MSKVVVINNLTLDGVMQAPGRATRTPVAVSSTEVGR
jgi:hypothetical protein